MMDRDIGNKSFPIWLIGDSNPAHWQENLNSPLDPRHPIRHIIWTSVLDEIQDKVFRESRLRINTADIYIRNAIDNPELKPGGTILEWGNILEAEILVLKKLLVEYCPIFVFSFGAFSFEFVRRTLDEMPRRNFGYWGAKSLGEEFVKRMSVFSPEKINLLPMLHRSIAGGKFIQSHNYFCDQNGANYFEYVGSKIAEKLLVYQQDLPIWIE